MKMICTSLLLCFCALLTAQEDKTMLSEEDIASSFSPFSWYLKQEERKEDRLTQKLDSLSLFKLKNRSKEDKKLVILLNMPIYEGPKGLSLMPNLPIDTTNTYYMKIYPVKE